MKADTDDEEEPVTAGAPLHEGDAPPPPPPPPIAFIHRRARPPRADVPRPRSVPVKGLPQRSDELLGIDYGAPIEFDLAAMRPRDRSECPTARPCPWVGCRHHLALEVAANGSLQLTWPDRELDQLPATCSLDLGDEPHTLEQVAQVLNVTRERVRQLETRGLRLLRPELMRAGLRDSAGFAAADGPIYQEGSG